MLNATYSGTDIRGDGPVVVVPFTSYSVEVIPAFYLTSGQYWVCNTSNGGSYETTDPTAEIKNVGASDVLTKGNTRRLIRMMKCWQGYSSVPLKSFQIELLAIEFLARYSYASNSAVYHDWMVRDFLKHMIARAGGYLYAPGTSRLLPLGDDWKSKAETALGRAEKACTYETSDSTSAGQEWQKIFGTYIPL